MDEQNKLEVLALLETYRMKAGVLHENNPDHSIRVCQAIVAHLFGYEGRNDWVDDIQEAGLVDYHVGEQRLLERYKALTEIVDAIKI